MSRIFTMDGVKFKFNDEEFKSRVYRKTKNMKITQKKLTLELSEKVGYTTDAVKNWIYGYNGPGSIEDIKIAADYLETDWKNIVIILEGEDKMNQLNARQKDAAKRIYDVLVRFLDDYCNTDGFNCRLDEFCDGSTDPEDAVYEYITKAEEHIHLVMDQEYFDLHGHEIYNELWQFACEDLTAVYAGKVGYDDSLDISGDSIREVWDIYEAAMQKLNGIVRRYT